MLKNLIKFGKILASKTNGAFQIVTATFFGKTQDVNVANIYGISFGPVKNSFALLFSRSGYEDSLWALIDEPSKRFTGLKEGELKIGNYETGDFVYFKADGTIGIQSASKVLVTAPEIEMVASTKVTITSPLVQVSGIVEANDFKSPAVNSYDTHIHGGVTAGGANTGGPT